jgi:hypothetical protein
MFNSDLGGVSVFIGFSISISYFSGVFNSCSLITTGYFYFSAFIILAKDAIAKADASAEIAKNTIEAADDAIAKTEDKHNDNQANDKTQEDFNNKGTGEGIDVTDDSTAYDTNVLVIDMTNGTLIDQNTEGTQYKLTEDSVSDSTDDILIYQNTTEGTWYTEEGINLTDVFISYGINDILIDQNTEETPYFNSTGCYKTVNESIVADISGNNWNESDYLQIPKNPSTIYVFHELYWGFL